MKVTPLMNLFLQFDTLHKRIDLQRVTAYVLTLLLALGWAFHDVPNLTVLVERFAVAAVFAMIVRLLLEGVGASRIASLAFSACLLAIGSAATMSELATVTVYAFVLLLVQLYFVLRTKFVAAGVLALLVLLISGAGEHAVALAVLAGVALVARVIWHGVLEHLSRKAFVLFAAKAAGMAVVVGLVGWLAAVHTPWSYGFTSELPAVHMPVWLAVVVAVLALRGLWAALLLRTDRSPRHRGLRMFYAVLATALLVMMLLFERYGSTVFTPRALEALTHTGVTEWGLATIAYAVLAVGLFATAGIDRSLYEDTYLARAFRRVL